MVSSWKKLLGWDDPRAKPFGDLVLDVKSRFPYYLDDWRCAWKYGIRILAPATYVFFTSILPAVSFGEQLAQNTEGELTAVHVVFAGALGGIIQTFVGGQPLAVIGVAQPIVTIISFQFTFVEQRSDLDRSMFLPWVAWTGIFAAIFLILMSIFGICRFIYRFTRMSGETFGMLIAVLFLQQAVVGMISEFRRASEYARAGGIRGDTRDPNVFRREDEDLAIMTNGLWALFLFAGMVSTSLAVDKAREWRFGTLLFRRLLAEYGVPFMVVVWTGLSYSLQSDGNERRVPSSIPRRVTTPLLWQVKDTWRVAERMGDIPGPLIAAALVPGIILAILFWFDHGVSIKLGMPKELNLQKPAAYAWDQIVLSITMVITALLGCPFPNAAIPQCPMHTNALATMRMLTEIDERRQARKEARAKRRLTASGHGVNGSAPQLPSSIKRYPPNPIVEMEASQPRGPENGAANGLDHQPHDGMPNGTAVTMSSFDGVEAGANSKGNASLNHRKTPGHAVKEVLVRHFAAKHPAIEDAADSDDEEEEEEPPPPAVAEQRLSNLIQSMMLAVCLVLMHVIQLIPTAVIWGYFAYMAITSFDGMQFWDRMMLVFTDRKHYPALVAKGNADYLKTVPYPTIVLFTALQFGWLTGLWALVTWAGVGGVAFPAPVVALIPIRAYILPYIFKEEHLEALDPLEKDHTHTKMSSQGQGEEGLQRVEEVT